MKKAIVIRLFGVLAVFGLFIGLAGCATEPAENNTSVGENEFLLSSLPELEPFEAFTDISSRYYENYTDKLRASDEYGRLYPYPGKVLHSSWMNETRYGLCDAQGRIVLDPVCTYISIQSFDAGVEIMQLSYAPASATEEDMSSYESINNVAYAAVDGSWVVDDCPGYLMYADEEVFIIGGVDYDDTYIYTTNYVYNMADGTLRSQFPMSQLVAYQKDMLIIGERGADGNTGYRLTDYDGNTIRELECTNAVLCGEQIIVANANGLWGITDLAGNYLVEPQYQYISSTTTSGGSKYFCADTVAGTTQLITADGQIVLDIASGANISSVNDEKYPDLYYVREYGQPLSYLIDVSTGDQGLVTEDSIEYIGNGWYAISNYENKLTIYKWGQNEPWAEITEENYLNARCELLQGTENILSIHISSLDANDNPASYTLLYDLAARNGIATIDGVYSSYIDAGEGYTFWNSNSGSYSIYDAEGNLLRNTGFTYLNKVDDGHYTVANNLYGGVVDSNGKWLIRIYINTLD